MIVSYIPRYVLEEEQIVALKDMGIKTEDVKYTCGNTKINCLKVYNLTETQVWDKLDTMSLLETTDQDKIQKNSYAQRAITVVFMQLRKITTIKDKDLRAVGAAWLLAAINGLASLDVKVANRFLALVRGIS